MINLTKPVVQVASVLLICAAMMLAPIIAIRGQEGKDIGKSAKEVLAPQTVQKLTGKVMDPLPDMQKLADIAASQRVIVEQLKIVLDVAQQVAMNTPRITNLEVHVESIETHLEDYKKSQSNEPAERAVIKDQVGKLVAVGTWLLAGVGALLLGGIGFVAKKVWDGNMPPDWATFEHAHQEEYRGKVLGELKDLKSQTDGMTEKIATLSHHEGFLEGERAERDAPHSE